MVPTKGGREQSRTNWEMSTEPFCGGRIMRYCGGGGLGDVCEKKLSCEEAQEEKMRGEAHVALLIARVQEHGAVC